jgi:hypothetical protein
VIKIISQEELPEYELEETRAVSSVAVGLVMFQ